MLAFVVFPALLAVVSAAPGGYTGLGGMYKNMQVYMGQFLQGGKNGRLMSFLSPSGDLGIGLVWHNLSPPPHRLFGPTVEILFKLN